MKNRIIYCLLSLFFLILCICIVLLFHSHQFIRGFLGDAVIVMLLYCLLKIVKDFDSIWLSIGVTIFAYIIEITQYFKIVTLLGFKESYFTKLVFGSVFDPMDLVAYTIGGVSILLLDIWIFQKFLEKEKCLE